MHLTAELTDKLLIRETLERYMRWNDDNDAGRIVTLFTADAIFRVMGRVYRGVDEIEAFFVGAGSRKDKPHWAERGRLSWEPGTAHLCTNPVIELQGDRALVESDFTVISRGRDGRAKIVLAGRYRDAFRRDADGRWLIAERTAVSLHKDARSGGGPGPDWPAESFAGSVFER